MTLLLISSDVEFVIVRLLTAVDRQLAVGQKPLRYPSIVQCLSAVIVVGLKSIGEVKRVQLLIFTVLL